jgi:hypothetical protein
MFNSDNWSICARTILESFKKFCYSLASNFSVLTEELKGLFCIISEQ